MERCDHCGNDYDKTFSVNREGVTHVFDSFECAIAMMAPECERCRCRIIGHGVEAGNNFYCCVHCAEESGVEGLRDRKAPATTATTDR